MTVLALREFPTPDPRTLDEPARSFALALSGQYAIKKVLGRGGMGIVYLARDKRLDRLVAIKTLPPHLASDASVRERFLRETRLAGSMSHPNIVPIHGADDIDGHVFFVMAHVDGDSLATHVRRGARPTPLELTRILRDVAYALSHAHQRGIIHRDIKAENILIDRESGRSLVTDFGIARLAEAAPITATGQLLGTVYYVSPEQVSGDPIDGRSDLYSLGVVGYYALTGRFPFDSELASAVLVAHVTRTAPPLSSIAPDAPTPLTSIIERCLSKNPAHRFETADALATALERAMSEIERGSSAPIVPRLVSDTEAHAVWHRAAELHASTGVVPRPEATPRTRDTKADAERDAGFAVDDVRNAGREAGIPTQYLEHALVEHGLAASRRAAPTDAAPQDVIRPLLNPPELLIGVPLTVGGEVVLDGEVDHRAFNGMITSCRDAIGKMGLTPARVRELLWRADLLFGGSIEVSVTPADGKTRIRVARNMGIPQRLRFLSSVGVFGLVGGTMASIFVFQELHAAGALGAVAAAGMMVGSIMIGRWFTKSAHDRESTLVNLLLRDLTATARDSIEASGRTPAKGILPR